MFEPGHWLAPNGHDPASRLHAWLDLCQMATHKPRKVRHLSLERGQVIVSLRSLAKRWRWHLSSVQRFISELKVSTALRTVGETPQGTIYHVVNYDTYAVGEKLHETPSETPIGIEVKQEQEGKHSRRKKTPTSNTDTWKVCPDSWSPNDGHLALARKLGVDFAHEEIKFRSYHFLKPHTNADSTFTNWLVSASSRSRNGKHADPSQRLRDNAAATTRALDAMLGRNGA